MWTMHCDACVTFCRRGEHDSAAGIAVSILQRKKKYLNCLTPKQQTMVQHRHFN